MGIHKIAYNFLCFGTPVPALATTEFFHQSFWKLAMQFSHQLSWPQQISATEHSPEFSLSCWPVSTCWEHNWSAQTGKKRIFDCGPNSILRQNTAVDAHTFVGHMHAIEFLAVTHLPALALHALT